MLKQKDDVSLTKDKDKRVVIHITARFLLVVTFIAISIAFFAGRSFDLNNNENENENKVDAGTPSNKGPSVIPTYGAAIIENRKGADDKQKKARVSVCEDQEHNNKSDQCYDEVDFFPQGLENLHVNINIEIGDTDVDVDVDVDPTFLNSSTRLIEMMQDIVTKSHGDELLSHQCHDRIDDKDESIGGVLGCIGFLSDSSHISISTHRTVKNRIQNVMILFTNSSRSTLMKIVQVIQKNFDSESESNSSIQWEFTPYQQLDGSIGGVISYPPRPSLVKKEQLNYEAFHEAFVHPVMLAHDRPERVAILGGIKSPTLREVLKHKDVKSIDMYYQSGDELLIDNTSKQNVVDDDDDKYIDCSDILGVAPICHDDERVNIKQEDILTWFNSHISTGYNQEVLLDVLMMNINPSEVENDQFIREWYTNEEFIKILYKSLNNSGMIIFQLGQMPNNNSPLDSHTMKWKTHLMALLETAGFKSIHIYSESHGLFSAPLTFVVAMKDPANNMLWYQTASEMEVIIHGRINASRSGSDVLKHFDSSAMRKYQVPHKALEISHCQVKPELCDKFENMKSKKNVSLSKFDVKMSTVGEGSGRGLFAGTDIKKGSTIGIVETRTPVYFHPSSLELIYPYSTIVKEMNAVWNYADGYGWEVSSAGTFSYLVEPNVLSFANHGCNGNYNIVDTRSIYKYRNGRSDLTEQSVELSDFAPNEPVFSPYDDRKQDQLYYIEAVKDINAGEEIFCDYLFMSSSSAEEFYEEAQVLKRICNGEEVGIITQNEPSD